LETKNKTVKIVSRNHKYANTWGGSIWEGDFCTSSPQECTVDKIINAWNFDKQCKKNLKKRAMTYGYDLK
jgi:hypothetical protein